MESRWINYIAYGLVATLGIITMVWIVPNGRVYPYSDEWGYIISVTIQTPADFVRYLFAQHVDHRIPLQKLLHQIVLRLTEFDFRALIAMSLVFTCALAVMMMNAARMFRRRALLGDLFIPFCALNLGSSAFFWGFGFQFVSSTFFAAAFLYLIIWYERSGRPVLLSLAFLSLFLCAGCGLNGTIVSTVLTVIMAFSFWRAWMSGALQKLGRIPLFLGVLALTNAVLWFYWSPSSAAAPGNFSLSVISGYVFGLINSNLFVYYYADEYILWKFAIIAGLLTVALYFGIHSFMQGSKQLLSDAALFGTLCALLASILAVAIGRSNHQPWTEGLALHYGYLTVLVPMVAWVIVSSKINPRAASVLGIVLLALYGSAYWTGLNWHIDYLNGATAHFREVQREIAINPDAKAVTEKYIRDFNYMDVPAARESITRGIPLLRQYGGSKYRP